MNKVERFKPGQKYRVVKDYYGEALPLIYKAKKGEILIFEGKSLYAHFINVKGELILMSYKEAFKFLENA
jgi:dihydrofolate reductase